MLRLGAAVLVAATVAAQVICAYGLSCYAIIAGCCCHKVAVCCGKVWAILHGMAVAAASAMAATPLSLLRRLLCYAIAASA